jgi:WD40 repeat protein
LIKEDNDYDLKIISILGGLCAATYMFEYLFDEIFIHSCNHGDIHAYVNKNIEDFKDEKNKKEEDIEVDEDIIKEVEEEEKNKKKLIIDNFNNLVQEKILKYHSSSITNLLVLKDGRLSSSSGDCSIIIYDKKIFTQQCTIKEHSNSIQYFTQISNDNIVSCSCDNTIKIFKLISETEYQLLQTLSGHSSKVNKVIEDNQRNLISCSDDHTIKIWSYNQNDQTYNLSKTININDNGNYYNILLLKENEIVSSSYSANCLKFWDINNSNLIKSLSSFVCG